MVLDGAGEPHRDEGNEEEPKIQILPPEVIDRIIKECSAPVILQLRLVSNRMKTLVDTSTRFKEFLNSVEVNLHCSTVEDFVTSAPSLPFSRFSIDLSPPKVLACPGPKPIYFTNDYTYADIPFPPFYVNSPHLEMFKEKICPKIRRLRLSAFFCGTTDEELDFLKSLKVLEELDIKIFRLLTHQNLAAGQTLEVKAPRIPSFPALKRLSVQKMERFTCQDYLNNWIASTHSLVFLALPLKHEASFVLRLGSQGHLPNLQRLHLNSGNFEIQRWSQEDLDFLRNLTSRRGFRLEGVSMFVLSSIYNSRDVPLEIKRAFFACISTSEELWEPLADLENLEDLKFDSILRSYTASVAPADVEMRRDRGIFRLPFLKKITAHILAAELMEGYAEVFQHLLDRVFRPQQPRLNVTHLDIKYEDMAPREHRFPPTFTSEYLHLGFPNLKKLKLELSCFGFDGMDGLFDVLSEKVFLEELDLCVYEGIPETPFTGSNPPGLLKLKSLKKLRLDTPSYPKETADRMSDGILVVLSQMTLTHLHVTCKGPTNVTGHGLRTLSDGPLGQTILWMQLKDLGASLEAEERREVFEGLSRVCHTNRFARGLTSSSFQQFQISEAAFLQTEHPFRRGGWIDQEIPTSPVTFLGSGFSEGL